MGEQLAGLYEAHARRVRLVCLRLLRDPHEADDALQQAFLSAYRTLLRGGTPEDAEAWLVAIARNECRTRIRDRMRAPLAELEVDELPGRADPVDEAELRAHLAAVLGAIDELPRRERDAIVLQAFGGVSNADVARRLGTTESAVESLLVRARAQLRARVSPVATAARALLLAPPMWLRALLSPGGGDVAAVTKMGTAVAVVGTVVALGQATPSGRPLALGGPAVADAASVASVAAVRAAAVAPRFVAPRLDGSVPTARRHAHGGRVRPLLVTRSAAPRETPSETVPHERARSAADPPGATPAAPVAHSGGPTDRGDDSSGESTTDESGREGEDDGSSGEGSGSDDSAAVDGDEGGGSSGPGGGETSGGSEGPGGGGASEGSPAGAAEESSSDGGQSGSGPSDSGDGGGADGGGASGVEGGGSDGSGHGE